MTDFVVWPEFVASSLVHMRTPCIYRLYIDFSFTVSHNSYLSEQTQTQLSTEKLVLTYYVCLIERFSIIWNGNTANSVRSLTVAFSTERVGRLLCQKSSLPHIDFPSHSWCCEDTRKKRANRLGGVSRLINLAWLDLLVIHNVVLFMTKETLSVLHVIYPEVSPWTKSFSR